MSDTPNSPAKSFPKKVLLLYSYIFDFSSAFDTVRYNVLLWKLENEFFVTGGILDLLWSFLQDRCSAVKFLGMISEWLPDSIGVPQGGALSPILFLLYINGISVLMELFGVYLGIFADDLCLFTSGVRRKSLSDIAPDNDNRILDGLQEVILFIQWYSLVNGLLLNYDKTHYKVFSKSRTKNYTTAPLAMSACFNNQYTHDTIKADQTLPIHHEPVKYLGIWMDTNLNWQHHCTKILDKCYKIYWTIQRNLNVLWNIKTNIVWQILDACILSIIDYSSIILPMMLKRDQNKLVAFYDKIVRKVCNPPKHIPKVVLYQQLHILDFDCRWKCKVSQYYTHLLRLSITNVLQNVIANSWWK